MSDVIVKCGECGALCHEGIYAPDGSPRCLLHLPESRQAPSGDSAAKIGHDE